MREREKENERERTLGFGCGVRERKRKRVKRNGVHVHDTRMAGGPVGPRATSSLPFFLRDRASMSGCD